MNTLKILFLLTLLVGLGMWAMIKATDRICDKPFSKEFKQTQQYKDMKCPESK